MNVHSAHLSTWTLKIGFLISIVVCAFFVTQSSLIVTYPYIGTAITIDMLFTLPIAYFIFIRQTAIPNYSVLLVFGASAATASFLLPANDKELFNAVALYGVPVVELGAFAFVGWRIFRARRSYMAESLPGRDLFERSRAAFTKELHPAFAACVMAFELSAIVYAFFKWRSNNGERSFTYHKKNGSTLLLGLFLFLLGAETAGIHVLIAQWNVTVAWVLTAASIYVAFQIFAHLKALRLRPISFTENELLFRCGLVGDAAIDLSSITKVDVIATTPPDADNSMTIRPLGAFSQPNIQIYLSEAQTFSGFYGIEKQFDLLSFYVDEPTEFVETVLSEMNK